MMMRVTIDVMFSFPCQVLISRSQADKSSLMNGEGQSEPFLPRPRITALDGREFLHQPDSGIAGFGERELLTNADPWSTIEW